MLLEIEGSGADVICSRGARGPAGFRDGTSPMRPVDPHRKWYIVALVFLFLVINFADKAVIGLSAVPIMKELGLTNTQFGTIGSAFFLLFSVSGILGGFLANHVSSKRLLLGMAILWAVAQAPMIGTVGFTTLLVARMALGFGEGPAFPLALHAVYKWFDDKHRTVPTSVVACGAAFGAGVVAPLITAIIVHFGWHVAFGVLAAASLLWAVVWAIWGAEGEVDLVSVAAGPGRRVPYRQLILSRTALGVFIGGFAAYWALTLNIVWLASYLIRAAHFSPVETGWIIVLPSAMQILLAPTIGAWSDRQMRRGLSSRVAQGIAGGVCLVLAGAAIILLPLVPAPALKIPLAAIAFSIGSVFFTLGSPLIAEISPPAQRGAMLGIANSIHALAGLVAPVAMGIIVDVGADPTAGFRTGFLVAGSFVALGGLLAMALVNPQADRERWAEGRATDGDRATRAGEALPTSRPV